MSRSATPCETGSLGKSGLNSAGGPMFPLLLLFLAAVCDGAERPGQAARRSAAPPSAWDASQSGAFSDDAVSTLQGVRPNFPARHSGPAAPGTDAGPDSAADHPQRPKWSFLVSEATLTDEIKDFTSVATAATTRPTEFKGGGFDRARKAFAALAFAFAVIAEHDQDVRWKKDAANARDLFSGIGFHCNAGTDESLAEARLGVLDLESLLQGSGPMRQSDRAGDFLWSQVADRPTLMQRLGAADEAIGGGVASEEEFARSQGRLLHEAEIVAAVAEVVRMPDFEDHDDGTYRTYSERMRDAALNLREACTKADYRAARSAAGELKKSCAACHGDYRG